MLSFKDIYVFPHHSYYHELITTKESERYNMIQTISKRITQSLLTREIIEKKLVNVYQYGTELMLSCFLTSGSILILSCIIDSFGAGLLYLAIYITLKGTTGGYHASSYKNCFIISIFLYILQTIIVKVLSTCNLPYWFWLIILFLSSIYIFCNAPVKNHNHPIGAKSLRKNQIRARIRISALSAITALFYILPRQSYLLNYTVITIASIAIFMYIALRKEKIQK